jgi:hypothetical protein
MATKKNTEIEIGEVIDSAGNAYTGENSGLGESHAPEKPAIDMEAVRAEIAQMLAEVNAAKAETEKLYAEIEAKQGGKRGAMSDEERAYMEEYVEVTFFKDAKEYKNDIFIGVNGEFVAIQRGVPVKVKRKFLAVYEAGHQQDMAAVEYRETKQREGEKKLAEI